MIWTFLATAGGFLKRIPLWAYVAVAAVIGVILWGNHRYDEGRADVEAEYAEKRAEALAQARKADAAGVEAANAGKTLSEAEIDRAREAAANNSGDPWKAATEAMRPTASPTRAR